MNSVSTQDGHFLALDGKYFPLSQKKGAPKAGPTTLAQRLPVISVGAALGLPHPLPKSRARLLTSQKVLELICPGKHRALPD